MVKFVFGAIVFLFLCLGLSSFWMLSEQSIQLAEQNHGVEGPRSSISEKVKEAQAEETLSELEPPIWGAGMARARLKDDLELEEAAAVGLAIEGQAENASEAPNIQSLTESLLRDGWTKAKVWGGKVKRATKSAFTVQRVSVRGNYYLRDREAKTLLDAEGQWLWWFRESEAEEALEGSPWVEEARVELRWWPREVVAKLRETKPWIVAEFQGSNWLVSREGLLIQPLETLSDPELIMEASQLPRVSGVETREGERRDLSLVDNRLAWIVRMIETIQLAGGLPFDVERFEFLAGEGLKAVPVQFRKYPETYLRDGSYEEMKHLLKDVRALLQDLESRKEEAASVDLRFRGQAVVRLKNNAAEKS